jgi:type VI secretion system secreted protein Hcp
MPAFAQIGDIQGEATDTNHKNWIIVHSMSSGIVRSIPVSAKDQQRTKGETSLGDIVVVRHIDKSSPKLAEACATGKFFPAVQIDFCSTVKGNQQPYLQYQLKNVIITGYSFSGNATGDPIPSEQLTLGYTDIQWTYVVLDPQTGDNKGQVPGKYNPSTSKGS